MPVAIQTPDANFVFWGEDAVPKRKRRCAVCTEAGRDGYNCPGEQKTAKSANICELHHFIWYIVLHHESQKLPPVLSVVCYVPI